MIKEKNTKARLKRRDKKNIIAGIAYVKAGFNNTIITITDMEGNPIAWSSAGSAGFEGSRRSTPYAAQVAAEQVAIKAMEHGMKELDVYVKGPGAGRDVARTFSAKGFEIKFIKDVTRMPHNGCRPPKKRRN